jgi:hypothetical protein
MGWGVECPLYVIGSAARLYSRRERAWVAPWRFRARGGREVLWNVVGDGKYLALFGSRATSTRPEAELESPWRALLFAPAAAALA